MTKREKGREREGGREREEIRRGEAHMSFNNSSWFFSH